MMKRIQQWCHEIVMRYNHPIQRQIDLGMVVSVEDHSGYTPGVKGAYVIVDSKRVHGGRELYLGRVWAGKDAWDNATLVDVNERDAYLVTEVSDEAVAERMGKPSEVRFFIADEDATKVELDTKILTGVFGSYNAYVSLHNRTVSMAVSHVRQKAWSTELNANAEAMMCEEFWHATVRTEWAEKVKTAKDGLLMVHVGTREAALDRTLLAHDNADEIDLYRVRINNTARIMETFVRDQGDGWHETYKGIEHHGYNTFAYINKHEDCESTSVYIQASALDVMSMETLTIDQVREQAENAPESLNGRNTGRLVAA